jgi:hypothetical protein
MVTPQDHADYAVLLATVPSAAPRMFFGKPLAWSRSWTAVVVLWVACASLLGVARLEMGHLTSFSAREVAAIQMVRGLRASDGERYGDLLHLLSTTYAHRMLRISDPLPTPSWYAFDRPWEHSVYVDWDFGGFTLSFRVHDHTVTSDTTARLVFATLSRLQTQR